MEQLRQDNPNWGPVRRALFRFLFSYLVLYNCPFPLDAIPVYGEVLEQSYRETWNMVLPWVGEHGLGVEVRVRGGSGRGDSTYGYVQIFCYLILALAATAVWTEQRGHAAPQPLSGAGFRLPALARLPCLL